MTGDVKDFAKGGPGPVAFVFERPDDDADDFVVGTVFSTYYVLMPDTPSSHEQIVRARNKATNRLVTVGGRVFSENDVTEPKK